MSPNRITSQEEFSQWLSKMDEEITALIAGYPVEMQKKMDFSPASLDIVEQWIIDNYSSSDALLISSEAKILDRLSRYVGETFRKKMKCQWIIDIDDPDPNYAYSGIPRLSEPASICPRTTVTASAHRRTGQYIRKILENLMV
jgi:hypothetical protein